jgi:ketosteroid isomerase-like protein
MFRNCLATSFMLAIFTIALYAQDQQATDEMDVIKNTIEDGIRWAMNKDLDRLISIFAHDENLFIFDPDSYTPVVGYEMFKQSFEFWMDPRFKATSFEVRDLRINRSRSGDVVWFSCFLDDLAEWNGKPIGWKNVRWTGVIEKRDGKWVHVQQHFSFPRKSE